MPELVAAPSPVGVPGTLVVSGGGESTSVVTEELIAAATQLESLTREAAALASEVVATDRELSWDELADAPSAARRAEVELDRAIAMLQQVEGQARVLAWSIARAADGYAFVEAGARRVLDRVLDSALEGLAGLAGMFAPALLPGLAVSATAIALLSPDDRNRLFSDPGVVAAICAGAMTVDDAVLGRLGMPSWMTGLIGDNGLGLLGMPAVAAGIAALGGSVGALRSSDVRIVREQTLSAAGAPGGFTERLQRVPDPDELGGAQVIVEKYEMPDGEIRAEVYVAGTVDFDPWADGEPWDMASNITNAIGPGSGSYAAVVAAMTEAGIDAETPVQLTGYSQGGGTVARLAESGAFDVRGLVTFGGPTGQVAVPEAIPTVIVEHSDDLVAALGGRQDNEHAVIVERYATEGVDFEDSELMPGHRLPGYLETARLMDADGDERLTHAARSITGFTDGGVLVSRVAYEVDRVSASS